MNDLLDHPMEPEKCFLHLSDFEGRQSIRNKLDVSLLVEAAAGTGKTTELVNRLVAVLSTGRARIDRIVAVTFTRKAAGELKLRLREHLDKARQATVDPQKVKNLEQAVSSLEKASIGTIHSFCADILRKRPVEAGVDPDFKELSEEEAKRLFQRTFRPWIKQKLSHLPPGLSRILHRSQSRQSISISTLDLIRKDAWKLLEWRVYQHPWKREPLERKDLLDSLVSRIQELSALSDCCANHRDGLWKSLQPVRDLSTWLWRTEKDRQRSYNLLEGQVLELLSKLKKSYNQKTGKGEFAPELERKTVIQTRQKLLRELESFKKSADADLAALLQSELQEVVQHYETLKKQSGKLDFNDLLIRTRDLIRNNFHIRLHFQQFFTHIFVDEFQDTDPLQAEILLLLSANEPQEKNWKKIRPVPGKLFLVGDPKQSIYRFRRADVVLYHQIKEILRQADVELVQLKKNFRSVLPLQQAINAAFEPEMKENQTIGQPGYVCLERHRPGPPTQPSIIALPAPAPFSKWGNVTKKDIGNCLPETVAAFATWLIKESGWQVGHEQHPDQLSPISPGHICILFKKFVDWRQDITKNYTRELEMRGIPHVLVGSKSFHEREEVQTIRTALTAIERPDDELAVYGTLRGSLFWIRDSLLLRFREKHGSLHPLEHSAKNLDTELKPVSEVLTILARLHRRRNRHPIVETLSRLLAMTRPHAGFALLPAGHQILANIQRLADLARTFEAGEGGSFRGFIEHLERLSDSVTASESQVLEEGIDGVHLMTVHKAKGLEFPIVILADMQTKLSRTSPDIYVDSGSSLAAFKLMDCEPWDLLEHQEEDAKREQAEGVRVAYVAATRARDLLVVPTLGIGPNKSSWLSPLDKAVYPAKPDWNQGKPAPGCPSFGSRSVLQDRDGSLTPCIQPGLHHAQVGAHTLTWWDPALLELGLQPNFGLQRERILIENKESQSGLRGLKKYQQWKERRQQTIGIGCQPSLEVLSVTQEPSPGTPPESPQIQIEILRIPKTRPSGTRFGTLVHNILRNTNLNSNSLEICQLARLYGKTLDVTNEERKFAILAVQSALEHSLFERARVAQICHREFPFIVELEDKKLLEGIIDLAFLEKDKWIVVDFKTDAHLKLSETSYTQQIQWYVYGLKQLTKQSTEGWLLGI